MLVHSATRLVYLLVMSVRAPRCFVRGLRFQLCNSVNVRAAVTIAVPPMLGARVVGEGHYLQDATNVPTVV